jgi:hypothetical protein
MQSNQHQTNMSAQIVIRVPCSWNREWNRPTGTFSAERQGSRETNREVGDLTWRTCHTALATMQIRKWLLSEGPGCRRPCRRVVAPSLHVGAGSSAAPSLLQLLATRSRFPMSKPEPGLGEGGCGGRGAAGRRAEMEGRSPRDCSGSQRPAGTGAHPPLPPARRASPLPWP